MVGRVSWILAMFKKKELESGVINHDRPNEISGPTIFPYKLHHLKLVSSSF